MANMLAYYGRTPDKKCEGCQFCGLRKFSRTCEFMGSKKIEPDWPACGKYQDVEVKS
jgi:hypothetical protein